MRRDCTHMCCGDDLSRQIESAIERARYANAETSTHTGVAPAGAPTLPLAPLDCELPSQAIQQLLTLQVN